MLVIAWKGLIVLLATWGAITAAATGWLWVMHRRYREGEKPLMTKAQAGSITK